MTNPTSKHMAELQDAVLAHIKALDIVRRQASEATNALAVAFGELHKINLMTSLGGEVDGYEAVTASVRKLADERDKLQQWVNDLQSGMYINCVYCGHRYGPQKDTPAVMADVLKAHIEKCPKHPLSKALAERDAAQQRAEKAEAPYYSDRLHSLRQLKDGLPDEALLEIGLASGLYPAIELTKSFIVKLLAERDRLAKQVEAMREALTNIHNMAVEELRRFDDTELQGHMIWQIEADARAALSEGGEKR